MLHPKLLILLFWLQGLSVVKQEKRLFSAFMNGQTDMGDHIF